MILALLLLACDRGGEVDPLDASLSGWPDDPVARVWVEHCRGAPPGWDGVVRLTTK